MCTPHHTHSSVLSRLHHQKTGRAWYARSPVTLAILITASCTSCTSSSCSSALLVPKLLPLLLLNVTTKRSLTSSSFLHQISPPPPEVPASLNTQTTLCLLPSLLPSAAFSPECPPNPPHLQQNSYSERSQKHIRISGQTLTIHFCFL